LFGTISALFIAAQQPPNSRPAPTNHLVTVYAVVPLTGAGTFQDPKRPLFAPLPSQLAKSERDSAPPILSYSFEISDDGRFALVEFRAADRKAFSEILDSKLPGVKAFERGRATKEEINAEFRKHKRDFDVSQLTRP
jgi:hypothetical protein